MADPDEFDKYPAIQNFFTFRKPVGSYFSGPSGPNQWGWLEVFPQHVFYDKQNNPEQVTVGVAQNALGDDLSFMSHKSGAMGRSWHNGKKDNRPGAEYWGLNFAEQWARALEIDPEFIFVTGWNEWVAGRFQQWHKYTSWQHSYHPKAMFVDQYNHEYSRDIEPMKGGHTDSYYYQLISYVRKFKGVRKNIPARRLYKIGIDGDFQDWQEVRPVFYDTAFDTSHRDFRGYGDTWYKNKTGRNDFVTLKTALDKENVYFYAKTGAPITGPHDKNWMLLFIDSDMNKKTGWQGYDYLINKSVLNSTKTTLQKYFGKANFSTVAQIDYKVFGNEIEIQVPLRSLQLSANRVEFDFHWADNIQKFGYIIEFSINGDSAPNRRFNYRFIYNTAEN
jgi:hypothetical protein